MEITESIYEINAPVQVAWSVLDDLPHYPEWNPILPELHGRTTVGETVAGQLVIRDLPTPPFTPKIKRIVPLRELRWVSEIPGPEGFSAEHIFLLEPTEKGTRIIHREIFDGPASVVLAPAIHTLVRSAYDEFDASFTARAEAFARSRLQAHPSASLPSVTAASAGKLICTCVNDPVKVKISAPLQHNHLCGCSRCWKPDGAILAQVGVVPADCFEIVAGREKLEIVDERQSIKRHACRECGTHLVGTVDDHSHHFYGLAFVHPELAVEPIAGKPDFAGFVSSIIESGHSASLMYGLRQALASNGIPTYDGFSPEIEDAIAYHKRKIASTTSSRS